MPVRKNRRRPFRRRRRRPRKSYYKKRKYQPSSITVRRPTIFPDEAFTKLTYQETKAYGSGIANVDNVYRGNSLFDPDQTGSGHQPMGLTEWETFYSRYIVFASKIQVHFMSTSTALPSLVVGVLANNSTTQFSVTSQFCETPYSKFRTMGISTGGSAQKRLSMYQPTGRILGVRSDKIRIDDTYSALTTGNPTREFYYHVYMGDPQDTDTSWAVEYMVKITYYCKFYQRLNIPQS